TLVSGLVIIGVIALWSNLFTDTSAAQSDPDPSATPFADIVSTPTPRTAGLEPGESRAIAFATDQAMAPTPRAEVEFEPSDEPIVITFDDFYAGYHPRYGLVMNDEFVAMDGQTVTIEGYMAPPLKPALDWFVLTSRPLALCPFCSTDSDWPNDIALTYMPEGEMVLASEYPLRLTGQLEIGSSEDAETGMISLVRIYVEEIEQIR
ncbi:MAG: hypothetical protein AAF125_18150, partial [Chloroflexota bacterium]